MKCDLCSLHVPDADDLRQYKDPITSVVIEDEWHFLVSCKLPMPCEPWPEIKTTRGYTALSRQGAAGSRSFSRRLTLRTQDLLLSSSTATFILLTDPRTRTREQGTAYVTSLRAPSVLSIWFHSYEWGDPVPHPGPSLCEHPKISDLILQKNVPWIPP